MKKVLFYILIIVLIILVISIVFLLINKKYYKQGTIPEEEVKFEIDPQQIEAIKSLKLGQVLYGKVQSINGNQVKISIELINPLNEEDIRVIYVDIPINKNDEIIQFKEVGNDKVERVKASFDEIKVGDYITVIPLEDKKVIGLSKIISKNE